MNGIKIEIYRYDEGVETYTLQQFLSRSTNTDKEWTKRTSDGCKWFATRHAYPIIPYRLKIDLAKWGIWGANHTEREKRLCKIGKELAEKFRAFLESDFCPIAGHVDFLDRNGTFCKVDVDEAALTAVVTVGVKFDEDYWWGEESLGGPNNLDDFALRALCQYLGGFCDSGDGNPIPIEIPQSIGCVHIWKADMDNACFFVWGEWNLED